MRARRAGQSQPPTSRDFDLTEGLRRGGSRELPIPPGLWRKAFPSSCRCARAGSRELAGKGTLTRPTPLVETDMAFSMGLLKLSIAPFFPRKPYRPGGRTDSEPLSVREQGMGQDFG